MSSCDDARIVRVTDATREHCPILNKLRALSLDQGTTGATLEWQFRDASGLPYDLTDCLGACDSESSESGEVCGQVKVRFAEAVNGPSHCFYGVTATIHDAQEGLVRFTPPAEVANLAGLYQMSLALFDTTDRLVLQDKGYLSVERGLFGDADQFSGPPTLGEIRLALRDTAMENDLLDEVEFSDVEIVQAIIRPIQEFNEKPPPLSTRFSAQNFPFRHHWLIAITANLLKTAAHWYRRNKLNSSSGGLQLADRDKDNPYWQTATALDAEWQSFLLMKKAQLNAEEAYGEVSSPYSGGGWGW